VSRSNIALARNRKAGGHRPPVQQAQSGNLVRVKSKTWGGLLIRKERWTFSRKGKLLVLALALVLAITVQREVNPFLSVTHPVHGEYLVVEGWMPTYVMSQAATEFNRGHYRKLLLVDTFDVEQYKSDRVREGLIECGVQANSIETVFSPTVRKDRTYHLALTAKDWFIENTRTVGSLDVATLGPHARRSWLMFEKAFGNSANIGIVALDDMAYDGQHWWRSSEGVREVLGEVIAYIYARFYFVWT
jgi:hypothetical protein